MTWILLVLLYGILKGSREIVKKLAMTKNTVIEVLVVYTIISFLFVIPQAPKAFNLEWKYLAFIALKSFCLFLAWIFSFHSLKTLPVSLFGILDLSRVMYGMFFGIAFLGERLNLWQFISLILVCSGLLLLRFQPPFLKKLFTKKEEDSIELQTQPAVPVKQTTPFLVFLALTSCFLNAISGLMDKLLMKNINSSQMQFWCMFFLVIYYSIYILVKREKISSSVWKNGWVWLLAIMFVIGDKALFIANGIPESRITVMTIIKQSGCLVAILGGRFIFKEKNTGYRFFCAAIIIIGIIFGVIN